MHTESATTHSARGLRIGMAVSRYHAPITSAMREGALAAFLHAGGARDDLLVIDSPGAFELVALCTALARRGDFDAVVAIGCIIAGETRHDRYIGNAVASGLAHIAVHTGVPVALGVLTCKNLEQARERAGGGKGNKGAEAMIAAIEAAQAIRTIERASSVSGAAR
jgi:6,7-dimethyl-8-ribityllumazine synthase